ncbi:MAG: hypothetical protein RL383_321, partial [Actinomycetota bacterium]
MRHTPLACAPVGSDNTVGAEAVPRLEEAHSTDSGAEVTGHDHDGHGHHHHVSEIGTAALTLG